MSEKELIAIMAAIIYAGREACAEGPDMSAKEAVQTALKIIEETNKR